MSAYRPSKIDVFAYRRILYVSPRSILASLLAVTLLLAFVSGMNGGEGTALAQMNAPYKHFQQLAIPPLNKSAKMAASNTAVLTYKNDTSRTGQNTNETLLTTSNTNSMQFGKHVAYTVDGQIYAQPLYVPNLTIGGTAYNVVFAATENDSVYAFDADQSSNVAPLWHVSFLKPPNVTTVSLNAVSCDDISPHYGITGTPVIDAATNTLYVVVNTLEGSNNFYRLHALDITTGHEKPGSPVVITATGFNPVLQLQRAGLLLLNGHVYIAFGGHCDNPPYHGWFFAYDASTLTQSAVYNDSATGAGSGIWQSGQGLAADSGGNIYVMTGNGTFDLNTGGVDAGDTMLKLSTQNGLKVVDYFTPFNQLCLSLDNGDLGSGGTLLLPTQSGSYPNELIGVGKEGRIYVVDRDHLGGYSTIPNVCNNQTASNVDKIVQELPDNGIGGMFSSPVYWNGPTGQFVYFGGANDHLKAYSLNNGRLSSSPTSQTIESFAFPGGNPSLSSNSTTPGTGILWTIDSSATLHAYDATNLGSELYNSNQNGSRDSLGSYVKFSVPTVANGEVFVGTQNTLTIYGLLAQSFSGSLVGVTGTPAKTVNLSNEGKADWAHWGLTVPTSFDHKASVGQQISNYSVIGTGKVNEYRSNPNGYSWTDGTPTGSVTNTTSGIWIANVGNGFKISVPADTTSRTLKVYVGIWRSQGLFKATLSDNSAPVFSDVILNNQSGASIAVYTMTYKAASAGQTLTVSFTVLQSYFATGNVTLQSASLIGTAVPPPLTPYNNAGISNDSNPTVANYDGSMHSYSAQALQSVGITPGQPVVFNNVTFSWPSPAAGMADNYQVIGQSLPVKPVSGATTLAFLGSATNGPSLGNAVITYSDGSTQTFPLGFTDWALGKAPLSYGNQLAASMTYRNGANGKQSLTIDVFYAEVSLTPGKTVVSVTLPSALNQGRLHVFAIGTK